METTTIKWALQEQKPEQCAIIARALNMSPLVAQLLINRGIDTPEQAELFLAARLQDLHSPFLMKNMDTAVARVLEALNKKEKICVYGDYDVDGITASASMYLFLRELAADAVCYIPDRLTEGYGLNPEAIKRIASQGVRLIITVDCGISDYAEVAFAREKGIDVIVTDHHEVPDTIAPAHAVINPKQADCPFPFKGLAGVGVAFNLIMAIRKTLRDRDVWSEGQEPNLKRYLDLVAMGTIADIVPMVDENRILVRNGLEVISEGKRPGVKALKSFCGISSGEVTANMVGYRMAPRINSCGRMSNALTSFQLLTAPDTNTAFQLARKVDEENTRRQQVGKRILAQSRAMVDESSPLPAALILASEGWNQGVIGICASRLSETFTRPVILIAIDEKKGEGRGSARSIAGFDIYSAIKQCAPVLKAFGGHRGAAGMTVDIKNLAAFKQLFSEIAQQHLTADDFVPSLNIDTQISLGQLSYDILEEIESLAPFGTANPEPIFSSRDIANFSSMTVGNGHLKLKIKENDTFFDAIGFNMAPHYSLGDDPISLAFVPQFNYFNGEKVVQLNLRDIKTTPT
ncbi:MAG: single-stranded-DNA-specific exonuclease RecJ [Deltaproteobacteria bacterium]|nr:single-stranded-DNA-specific exonuclease RecJ [Deltaproteobacteria bacterium]